MSSSFPDPPGSRVVSGDTNKATRASQMRRARSSFGEDHCRWPVRAPAWPAQSRRWGEPSEGGRRCPSELAAEIRAPDLGIGEQFVARPLRARLSHDEDVPAPAQAQRLARVLLDEHDADAARIDVTDP